MSFGKGRLSVSQAGRAEDANSREVVELLVKSVWEMELLRLESFLGIFGIRAARRGAMVSIMGG